MIYLDNSATTRPYDEVIHEMRRMQEECFGNPSSLHRMGLQAEMALRSARKKVADALHADPGELLFTGSGGGAYANRRRGNKIIVTAIEHPAVLTACQKLERDGFTVAVIGVDRHGLVDLDELKRTVDASTILVSVMAVNNELGTVQPLEAIGNILQNIGGILFHTDGVQAMGKIPVDLAACHLDLMSVSAHKIHGPKGVGALYVKKGTKLEPLIYGGGQEHGLRGGTENTPGIVGFGIAAEQQQKNQEARIDQIQLVRTHLMSELKDKIEDCVINSPENVWGQDSVENGVSSPSILNVSFPGCRGEVLLHTLEQKEIFVSTGAACSSRKKASQVLTAAGLPAALTESAIRFSISEFNTTEEMDVVVATLATATEGMRNLRRRTNLGR
ncbi:MAG: cysteine desulfurase NifS [Firmicutes bacterium HGW-Firmicutes-11]|nr:MAG: cysteine desulfurase NifS [Firmicutes bacterium HGW-Firmicutes-11]